MSPHGIQVLPGVAIGEALLGSRGKTYDMFFPKAWNLSIPRYVVRIKFEPFEYKLMSLVINIVVVRKSLLRRWAVDAQ